MANLSSSYPGIAAATGTRVDSSRHNMACRINQALMTTWCENGRNAKNHMDTYKMKYCIHKDELVLNVGQALNDCSTICNPTRAYPSVVSSLADVSGQTKDILRWLYNDSATGKEWLMNKEKIRRLCRSGVANDLLRVFGSLDSVDKDRIFSELCNLPYFTIQGYSQGIAYASELSGDTVSTITIGGMQTVMNGAFACQAGQMIQWYFDFEVPCFHGEAVEDPRTGRCLSVGMRKGARIDTINNDFINLKAAAVQKILGKEKLTDLEEKRKGYHERALGMDGLGEGMTPKKRNIFYPKPYVITPDGEEHYADKIRIFAKCVNGARKHEMMDIMLMVQSL